MNDATQFFDTTAAGGGYEIERSLRFNSADSAYLSRTPSVEGNRKTWTWAGWVKRSALGARQALFTAYTNPYLGLEFSATDTIVVYDSTATTISRQTTAVYRDTSAWYHVVLAYDTTQATAANRVKLYVNGVEVTVFQTNSNPAQNTDTAVNMVYLHAIGVWDTVGLYQNGYLANIHFIDGQALDPSSFTEFDDNGVLQPKAYAGSYGTNGFYLPFSDNSTAAALGTDTSGNGNTWTVNNLSVTAGAGNDSLVDSPTNYGTDTGAGGEVRGNYCTWNPLDKDADVTLANGNLDMTQTAAGGAKGTVHVSSGKWYWEITKTTSANQCFGIATSAAIPSTYVGGYAGSAGFSSAGTLYKSGNFTAVNGGTVVPLSSGDILGFALDLDSIPKTLKIYRNGALQTANHFEISEAGTLTPVIGTNVGDNVTPSSANFGQRPFAYTAPSGFKALCTTNLPTPDPAITPPSKVMDVVTYTGTSANQTVNGLNFNPDFIWIKNRSNALAFNHVLQDSVRGFTTGRKLSSNLTNFESGGTIADSFGYISGSTADGFTLSKDGTGSYDWMQTNGSGNSYVAWAWDAGSSTVTNNDGSITSQVRANVSAGFSVVTYTGTGVTGTVGHGLGIKPSLIIIKNRDSVINWIVYHASRGATEYAFLNTTAAFAAASGPWNNTEPTSSVFTIGGANTNNNENTKKIVAYCFAPVAGYSAFGSYTGNGSADGPFVYTGFRPRWVLVKRSDGVSQWFTYDAGRNTYNGLDKLIYANLADAESTFAAIDFLSNGFKVRTNTSINVSAATYIYACFAESPFATARAR